MTGGKANLVCFDVNLLLNLLSTLTSLSWLASTWWDHLSHDYEKKVSIQSQCQLCEQRSNRAASAEGAVPGFSCNPADALGIGQSSPTTIPGQKQSLERRRGWPPWKTACSIWLSLLLLTQVDASPEAPGSHLLSRYLLLTFSNLNICSCTQRKDNML